MIDTAKPLLVRTGFHSGESLSSFLARLTELNGYEPPSLLRSLCLEGVAYWEDFECPYVTETYRRLEVLTHIHAERIYQATPHSLSEVLAPLDTADRRLHGRTIRLPNGSEVHAISQAVRRRQLRPSDAVQFCPACLTQTVEPYHRLSWLPITSSACLEHQCLLESVCHTCRRPVTIRDVVLAKCRQCGYDLRNTPVVSISEDLIGMFSQQIIQWWIGLSTMPARPWPFVLPDISPRALYHFLGGLAKGILVTDPGWRYWHRLGKYPRYSVSTDFDNSSDGTTSDEGRENDSRDSQLRSSGDLYCLYATAFKAIVGWPDGFFDFLRAYRLREDVATEQRLHDDFGGFFSDCLQAMWQLPSFGFVQRAFSKFCEQQYYIPILSPSQHSGPPIPSLRPGAMVSIEDAARLLGLPGWMVRRLVDNRCVTSRTFRDRSGFYSESVELNELLELRHRWRDGIPVEAVCDWIGEDIYRIEKLAKCGYMELVPSTAAISRKSVSLCRLLS